MRTLQIAIALAASALASIGLTVVYLAGGNPPVEGLLLGVALGGLGWGLVAWAHDVFPRGPDVEERGSPSSSDEERRLFSEDVTSAFQGIPRRRLITGLLGGSLGALVVAASFPVRSLGPSPGRALFETAWRAGRRLVDVSGNPIPAEALPLGGAVTAYPEGAEHAGDSVVILVRVEPRRIELPDEREDWAPEGYLCFSKICPHAGCPVGLFDRQTALLTCPCHQSAFLTLVGAVPISGPAARPLPQLPLSIDTDGYLIATGEFSAIVGPGFTGLAEG